MRQGILSLSVALLNLAGCGGGESTSPPPPSGLGAPASLAATAGDGQSGAPNDAVPVAPSVRVRDGVACASQIRATAANPDILFPAQVVPPTGGMVTLARPAARWLRAPAPERSPVGAGDRLPDPPIVGGTGVAGRRDRPDAIGENPLDRLGLDRAGHR